MIALIEEMFTMRSVSATHHSAQHAACQGKHRCQVYRDNVVPLFIFHPHEEIVLCNTRIVDQNINLARRFLGLGR